MRITYEDILSDTTLLDRIRANARLERAKAVHALIVQPIKTFFAAHAARPHLARQG